MSSSVLEWPLAKMYPYLIQKAERKGRTEAEVNEITCWLTGHTAKSLQEQLESDIEYGTFFDTAPKLNPNRGLITGVICGERVENISDPTWQNMRYLDKLVDELAQGKSMEKILREK